MNRTIASNRRAVAFTLALSATGVFALLVGVVLLAPFLLNARAQENDVFLTNLFSGPVLIMLGEIMLMFGLAGVGVPHWNSLLLASVIAVVTVETMNLLGFAGLQFLVASLSLNAVLVILSLASIMTVQHCWHAMWFALLLAAVGASSASLIASVLGDRFYAAAEQSSSLPLYANALVPGMVFLVGMLVFVVGWFGAPRFTGVSRSLSHIQHAH
jgi:hypothetical protein